VLIQAGKKYLEDILYEETLDYNFPSIIFNDYPQTILVKGDLKDLYHYTQSSIHIIK
jgi:hypothetical protein